MYLNHNLHIHVHTNANYIYYKANYAQNIFSIEINIACKNITKIKHYNTMFYNNETVKIN